MEKSKCDLIIQFAEKKFLNSGKVYDNLKNYKELILYLKELKITIDFKSALYLLKNSSRLKYTIEILNENYDTDYSDDLITFLCAYDFISNSNEKSESIINDKKYSSSESEKDFSALNLYRKELPNRILTPKEELELFKRKEAGDDSVLDTIIYYNLKLVFSVANEYIRKSGSIEFCDLIQEGNIGLIEAANRFDYKRGCKFSTFANIWIRKNISLAIIRKSEMIRRSKGMFRDSRIVMKYIEKVYIESGVKPTDEEIAQALNMSVEKVRDIKSHDYSLSSLDSKIGFEDDYNLYSLISDQKYKRDLNLDDIIMEEFVHDLEKCNLTDRELEIIKMRYGFYGEKYKLSQIAEVFEITHQRVDQIEESALKKLRKNKIMQCYNDEGDN